MRKRSRLLGALGLGVVAVVGAAVAVRTWVVPAVIVAQIRKHHAGHVTIRGWWVGWSSAGVTGLTLHEAPSAASPVWARVGRVTTDLSVRSLVRGRFAPRRITFRAPRVVYRIDRDGRPLTRLPLKTSKRGPTPVMIAEGGRLTMAQAGRPEMVVDRIDGRLDPDRGGARFVARSGDAAWGRPAVDGRFGPGFDSVGLRLTADPLPADRDRAGRIPFITASVWAYFMPLGPVRVVVDYARPIGRPGPSVVKTAVDFERTTVLLPHLELIASDAVGRLTYQDRVVRLDGVSGRVVGGRVTVGGSMDFSGRESRYDLKLGFDGVELVSFPASWSLDTVSLGGRLTGAARLLMTLTRAGLDVTGSSGRGTVEGASVKGVPLGRLGVKLRGEGRRPARPPAAKPGADGAANAATPGVFLPQWLGGDFEVRDVALERAVARVRARQGVREVPVSGRLGLWLTLRMPLGSLHDAAAYTGAGTADLSGATVGDVGLGRLTGRVRLSGGVLDVTDVRGRLLGRSGRGPNGTEVTGPPPARGPLPPGGFRGRFRADLAGAGGAEAEFEGERLPLDGLAPDVAGALTVSATARGDSVSDPRDWSGSGRAAGAEVVYRSARFRDVSATAALDHGRLTVPDLAARLDGRPLTGRVAVGLDAPHAFAAVLDAEGLPLADLLAAASPGAAKIKASGSIAARAVASGTLRPWHVQTRGRARVDRAEVDRVPLGDLPLTWETRGDVVAVNAREVQRYGGRISAEVLVPVSGDGEVTGAVTLTRVDTARLSAEAPGSLRLTGLADGQARFRLPLGDSAPPAEAEATFTSDGMTVEGVPARTVRARLTVHQGVPRYEATAEGLRGRFHVKGSGGAGGRSLDAEVRAERVELAGLLDALGASGSLAELTGQASAAARLRSGGGRQEGGGTGLRAQGSAEVRGLRWGRSYPIGDLRADFAVTPECWRVGHLGGTLLGGRVRGGFWRQSVAGGGSRYGVDLSAERVLLSRALDVMPGIGHWFDGEAAVTASGRSEGSFRGRAEIRAEKGEAHGIRFTGLSIPVDWDVRPDDRFRGVVRVRDASARMGGGHVRGEATARTGPRGDFHAEVTVSRAELGALRKARSHGGPPTPGTVDGVMTLEGPDLARVEDYTGKVELDLTGASLVDIPVLEELDRSLGSARGAVFDEGHASARIAHRAAHVRGLTLVGPLAQLHATGTVGLDGRLDLKVLVNTNDTIPEFGQAAIGRFSGAAAEVRRRGQEIDRVSDFLSSRLMKFRVTGSLAHPSVNVDGSIHVDEIALAFFAEAMRVARSRTPQ